MEPIYPLINDTQEAFDGINLLISRNAFDEFKMESGNADDMYDDIITDFSNEVEDIKETNQIMIQRARCSSADKLSGGGLSDGSSEDEGRETYKKNRNKQPKEEYSDVKRKEHSKTPLRQKALNSFGDDANFGQGNYCSETLEQN